MDTETSSEVSTPEARSPSRQGWLALLTVALLLIAGCVPIARLDVNFDADTPGSPPSVYPLPNPPNDTFTWTATQQVTSTVVAAPGGGNWLRITPTQAFIVSPDDRKRAIATTSETFTTSPPANIRGHLRLRLDGTGTVIVGFSFLQEQGFAFTDFIGGIGLASSGRSGEAYALGGFSLAQIERDIFGIGSRGTLANYRPGTLIDIFWSIDQASRTLFIGAGGPSVSIPFPATSRAGVATTPIQRLNLMAWLERPSLNTAVFIDKLYAEEYR